MKELLVKNLMVPWQAPLESSSPIEAAFVAKSIGEPKRISAFL